MLFKRSSLEDKKKLKRVSKFYFFRDSSLEDIFQRLKKKLDADLYLVSERNLEIFRLSLFTNQALFSSSKKRGSVFLLWIMIKLKKVK